MGFAPGEGQDRRRKAKVSLWQKYFGNIFTMRFEQDNVITYRKYWPTLFGKIWLPTLLIILVIIAMGIHHQCLFRQVKPGQLRLLKSYWHVSMRINPIRADPLVDLSIY